MITLLGKRPFKGKSDDMDKWLDENQRKSAPPPLEEMPGPALDAEPTIATKPLDL